MPTYITERKDQIAFKKTFPKSSINTFGKNTFGKIRSFWISSDMVSELA